MKQMSVCAERAVIGAAVEAAFAGIYRDRGPGLVYASMLTGGCIFGSRYSWQIHVEMVGRRLLQNLETEVLKRGHTLITWEHSATGLLFCTERC